MKIIVLFLSFMFISTSFAEDALLDNIRSKYNIVEGKYALQAGQSENCISGDYKLLKGGENVVSLQADNGLLAQNIHDPVVTINENGCSYNYTNTAYEGGLKSVEAVNCDQNNISYSRTLIVKFSDSGVNYKLSSIRPIEGKSSELTCRLNKVTE